MSDDRWKVGLEAFVEAFEVYIGDFPEIGWHEKYLTIYRSALSRVRLEGANNQPGQPFIELHCSVMLLLDGRKKLTADQQKQREKLVFRWWQLQRSANATPIQTGHRIAYPSGVYQTDSANRRRVNACQRRHIVKR
ncbi:MAG: hypothetical protein ACFHHU_00915 [Porticoccaceae bacterium]